MTQKYNNGLKVLSPGTVIISAVSEVSNINKVVKPNLLPNKISKLIYINLCKGLNLTGSSFYQTLSSVGNSASDSKPANEIKKILSVKKFILMELYLRVFPTIFQAGEGPVI